MERAELIDYSYIKETSDLETPAAMKTYSSSRPSLWRDGRVHTFVRQRVRTTFTTNPQCRPDAYSYVFSFWRSADHFTCRVPRRRAYALHKHGKSRPRCFSEHFLHQEHQQNKVIKMFLVPDLRNSQSLRTGSPWTSCFWSFSQGHYNKNGYIMDKIYIKKKGVTYQSGTPSVPAAPVRLIKSIWHIQVIQLSLMPASRGHFQDPQGTEVLASRI